MYITSKSNKVVQKHDECTMAAIFWRGLAAVSSMGSAWVARTAF
jgi:hypothetical protein